MFVHMDLECEMNFSVIVIAAKVYVDIVSSMLHRLYPALGANTVITQLSPQPRCKVIEQL